MVAARSLRVVFFGTPQFAVPTLDALLATSHTVVGVVTQPDRPQGRGQRTASPAVKSRSVEANVPVLQPERLRDEGFLESLTRLEPDLGVVAAYGKILTDAVLAIPARGLINVHASLLPRYRGAAPVHRAVIAGDEVTGVTIMRVVKALDAGPMLATVRRRVSAMETSEDVEEDLSRMGADLLAAVVEALADGPLTEVPQDESSATYAPRLTKADGLVDWERPAVHVHNLIRGLHPWPLAYTFWKGHRMILRRSTTISGARQEPPGTVVQAAGGRIEVAAGDGVVGLEEVQLEGGRPLRPRDFLAGHPLARGERFTLTP